MDKLKAKIFASPEKGMEGRELRRLRVAAGLSEEALALKIDTYRKQIVRWENSYRFYIHPRIMQKLLDALGASSL